MIDVWEDIDDKVRQAFLRQCTQQQLDAVLEKLEPRSLDSKYKLLEDIAQENCAMHVLAYIRSERKKYTGAEMIWRQLLHSNHPTNPDLNALFNLAFSLMQQQKYPESGALYRALTPLVQIKLGENSPQALGCVRNLGSCVHGQGRSNEAREILTVAKTMAEKIEHDSLRHDEEAACLALEKKLKTEG